MRQQIEERRDFTYVERQQIYEKSDYRCCKCGKKLDIWSKDSTIEHIIPLSKGGTNELRNLVCLCFSCNSKKDNLIIPPYDYYAYLKEEYHQEAIKLYENYCSDVSYYDRNNFTKDDARKFIYYNRMQSLESALPQSGRKNCRYGVNIPMKAVLRKAFYYDLDDIYEYCMKYHKKHNLDSDDLKPLIADVFENGALYIVSKGTEIISVIPISTSIIVTEGDEEYYTINIGGIPTLYEKDIYAPLIKDCITYILGEISKIDGEGNVVVKITVPTQDEFLNRVVYSLTPSNFQGDDEWRTYLHFMTFAQDIINYDGDDEVGIYRQLQEFHEDTEFDGSKIIKKFSKSLQRTFKLKPLNNTKKKEQAKEEFKKSTVKATKKRRSEKHKNIYYDPDYLAANE